MDMTARRKKDLNVGPGCWIPHRHGQMTIHPVEQLFVAPCVLICPSITQKLDLNMYDRHDLMMILQTGF